jgi:hypothetical protein
MKHICIVKFMLLFAACTLILESCGTSGNGIVYTESSIPVDKVKYKTVAILPNRLPMNLQNSEEWRVYNWEVIKEYMESKGVNVVDYNTSVELFKNSGLPMEDTKISRDKYAELAQKLNADFLVFPYYGVQFYQSGFWAKMNYISIGTLQVYSAKHNDFLARIDFDGRNYYVQGGILGSMLPPITIIAFFNSFKSPAKRWQKAFTAAINVGLDEFTAKYPPSAGSSNSAPSNNSGKYDNYSLEELQILKKAAVDASDFNKAAEIKDEIDRRTK